jgi:hypothetical protein
MEELAPFAQDITNETIEKNVDIKDVNDKENDVNVLSGDNKVDVEIEPDVKSNNVYVQLCSCSLSLVFNCFSTNTD